jgi:hypothetical protein
MGRKKTPSEWQAFLRALRGTGNVRAAAAEAGMDAGTAYDQRIKDARFAARMGAARAKGKAAAGKARRKGSRAELIPRKTKHGTQLVRPGPGRWNAKAEAAFRAEMRRTGCVRAAARACGFSTNALYKRRENYPDFAAQWAADERLAKERIPALLSAAAIAAFDPEVADDDLPKVNVDQAIAIARLKCGEGRDGRGDRRGRHARPEPTIEEVRDEIIGRIARIRKHRERGEGETDPSPDQGELPFGEEP